MTSKNEVKKVLVAGSANHYELASPPCRQGFLSPAMMDGRAGISVEEECGQIGAVYGGGWGAGKGS